MLANRLIYSKYALPFPDIGGMGDASCKSGLISPKNMTRKTTDPVQPADSAQPELSRLTLSQTTNFRLFQIEKVCRRQF